MLPAASERASKTLQGIDITSNSVERSYARHLIVAASLTLIALAVVFLTSAAVTEFLAAPAPFPRQRLEDHCLGEVSLRHVIAAFNAFDEMMAAWTLHPLHRLR